MPRFNASSAVRMGNVDADAAPAVRTMTDETILANQGASNLASALDNAKLLACPLSLASTHVVFGRRRLDWVFIECDESTPLAHLLGALLTSHHFALCAYHTAKCTDDCAEPSLPPTTNSLCHQLIRASPAAVLTL